MTDIIKGLEEKSISFRLNESMKLHTTFKTGGEASVFVTPANTQELMDTLEICAINGKEPFILGNGSNLLVNDEGITDKVVISMNEGFKFIEKISETSYRVGAGVPLSVLCKTALSDGLTGLEFAFGIPGLVGGAVFMNAGAYDGEIKNVVTESSYVTFSGQKGKLVGQQQEFAYRTSAYAKGGRVITDAVFELEKGDADKIREKMYDFLGRRKDKQPLDYPSAGSTFKRPVGYFAGALIEQSDLKGFRIGGAMVSPKHAGFVINYENATSEDIIKLILHCQKTVKDKFGVDLETEIKFV